MGLLQKNHRRRLQGIGALGALELNVDALPLMQRQSLQRQAAEQQHRGGGEGERQCEALRSHAGIRIR